MQGEGVWVGEGITELQANIAELDCSDSFPGGAREVESLLRQHPRQAWARVRREWGKLEEIERLAAEQPDLF